MAEEQPIVRTTSWTAVLIQMVILFLLIQFFTFTGVAMPFPFIVGPIAFLVFSFGLRIWLSEDHRKGMRAVQTENFHAALENFESSVAYFEAHPKIDRFRAVTLLSASKFSYKEMGLINIAYCYGQIGRVDDMVDLYTQIAKDYPENGIAKAALGMIKSLKEDS